MGQPQPAVNARASGCPADFARRGAPERPEPAPAASAIDVARARMHILPANDRGEN